MKLIATLLRSGFTHFAFKMTPDDLLVLTPPNYTMSKSASTPSLAAIKSAVLSYELECLLMEHETGWELAVLWFSSLAK